MMRRYNSKIGIGILLFVGAALVSSSALMIVNKEWAGLAIDVAVALFIVYIFTNTYYIITSDHLIVRCGFLINLKIDINVIYRIEETNNPISSPALSLDRLAIHYDAGKIVIVSPKEKRDFIESLIQVNSKIQCTLKKPQSA